MSTPRHAQSTSRFSVDMDSANLMAKKKSIIGFMRGAITPPVNRTRPTKELDLNLVNEKVVQHAGAPRQTLAAQTGTHPRNESSKTRSKDVPQLPTQPKPISMLNRFASKIRLPALPPPVTGGSHFGGQSSMSPALREQALFERGLLSPDLSRQEFERDARLSVDVEYAFPSSAEFSAASAIKREWEAKNHATIEASPAGANASTSEVPPESQDVKSEEKEEISANDTSNSSAPTRTLPQAPPVHVHAPSANEVDHWDPYSTPLPPSPFSHGEGSSYTPSVRSTKSIAKSIRSLAKSFKSTRSKNVHANNEAPPSPSFFMTSNVGSSSPLAHSFPFPNSTRTVVSPASDSSHATAPSPLVDISIPDNSSVTVESVPPPQSATLSEFDLAFFTPPTTPSQFPTWTDSPLTIALPPSPAPSPEDASPTSPTELLWAPSTRGPREASIPSTTTRSRSRSTVASSAGPLPSLSETASVVSDGDSEIDSKSIPPLPKSTGSQSRHPSNSQPMRSRDASARLAGLNVCISNANAGMVPVIVESPVEESWWPVVVSESPLVNEVASKEIDVVDAVSTPLEAADIEFESSRSHTPVPVRSNTTPTPASPSQEPVAPAKLVPEKASRRKSIFGRKSDASQNKSSVSSSLNSLRRSVVGTLSSKPAVSASRSAPNVRPKSVFKSQQAKNGFDASHLPASPTTPAPFAHAPSLRSTGSGARRGVAPTMHSRGSILIEATSIEDEESRRMTEMAFLG